MTLALSGLCCLFSLATAVDSLAFGGAYLGMLPAFTGTAAAVAGLLMAGMEYKARTGKKKRRAPMAWLFLNIFAGLLSAGLWAFSLIQVALG